MDFRHDGPLSHVVSWCKKIARVKGNKRIYPSLIPKTEYLFDLRDSLKEEMIKELMLGKTRTKECRVWLMKVREFEIGANELLKLHENTSDNLRIFMKRPHADMMNMLDEITHLLESFPLQGESKKTSCFIIDDKSFRSTETTRSVPSRGKTRAIGASLEIGTSHATYKETLPAKYVEGNPLMASSSAQPEGGQPFLSVESQVMKEAELITTVEPIVDVLPPVSGNYGALGEEESAAVVKPMLPTDLITSSSIDPMAKLEVVSSSRNDILPAHRDEIQLISFDEEMKPHLSPKASRTVFGEIEELFSSHEMNVTPPVEPTTEVGDSTSRQSTMAIEESVAITSSRKDEILLSDQVKTKDHHQTEDRRGVCEPDVDAKTTVECTVLKILELLNGETVRKIGVYGTAGVGKTTVLKALINDPKTKDMFDLIIWVTVSRCWSIRKIQHEVLRQLSTQNEALSVYLSKDNSEIGEQLFQYLKCKKFLLILDDVCEEMDLEAVGIPDPNLENGCGLILATRRLEVCNHMLLIKVIKVESVSKEEAWELFHEHVGITVDRQGIQSLAQGIVERCRGLPLLVIVTGRALSGEEDVFAWEQALRQFSGPYGDLTDYDYTIQMLKFSFDRLKFLHIQSCFLHCALFAEDQEVDISELVKYYIQEGLISGSTDYAYNRGHDIINVLVLAYLLENTNNHSIKMHDMMRALALQILSGEKGYQFLLPAYSKALNQGSHSVLGPHESQSNRLFIPDGHQFILRAGSRMAEPPSAKEWGKSKMIFLMDNNLSTLPERPSCPELLTLFLQRNFRLRVIPVTFFDCMPSLKLLNLSKTRIKSLPETISKLVSLETLFLCHCERLAALPSDIGSLELLEVLDLRGSEINVLPDEIGELAVLRYLDVCFYGSMNRNEYVKLPHGLISSGIISRLHKLESLRISVCPGDERWDKCVKYITCEVSELTNLTSLSFYFPEVELLELFLQRSVAWNDQSLTDYKIVVGRDIKRIVSRVPLYVEHDYRQMGQCLRFVNGQKTPDAIVKVLAHSSAFYLDHHLDISSISTFGIDNISKLKYCIVSQCPRVKAILDGEEFVKVVFPCLEHLSLHYLWNLKFIFEGVLPEGSFAMLRTLYVHACPKLKYVFKSSMIQFISNLEELIVDDCSVMEKIILNDKAAESSQVSLFNLKRLTLHYLPELDNVKEGAWPSFEYISVYNCPNLKKINLDSKLKHPVKEIKGEKNWWDALDWEEPAVCMHFQNLFVPINEDDI